MKRLKNYILPLLASIMIVSCSSSDEIEKDDDILPPAPPAPEKKDPKPKAMWIGVSFDLENNMLFNEANTLLYIKKCKEIGMNMLYLDAHVATGKMVDDIASLNIPQDPQFSWNITDYILSVCDTMGIDVVLGANPLSVGSSKKQQGIYFESDRWKGKTQCKKVMSADNSSYEIVDICNDPESDAIVLDPSFPEVREYAANLCGEIVKAYMHHPSFKGLSLDYVRYSNADKAGNWFGYGPGFTENFEKDMLINVKDQNDFINATGGFGDYFADWVFYRSKVVTATIRAVKERVKAVNPKCELHLWASAQWSSRYSVGQNWASKSYVPQGRQYKAGYEETGFAEDLDVFILGAYADAVYKSEAPNSEWSVENFVTTYDRYIPKNSTCKVYGSLAAYSCNHIKMRDSSYLCLIYTDGLMVFEMGHVKNINLWNGIREGISLSGY